MKNSVRAHSFFALVLLAAVAPVAAQESLLSDPMAALPLDSSVITGTFDNGLRYYIRPNSRPENRAELRLVVNAGSVLENENQRGLAHLLEHMAFNGTEHFEKQELVNYLERVGMRFGPNVNAFTSFDETVYMLRVPTDSAELLATGFQILEDWAHLLSLDEEEIDLERGVVVEEWRLGRGAGARIRDRQFPTIFANSRYADRLPIGTVDVLQSFEYQTLIDFYKEWYRPDLMAVVAVGDFDPAEIEALIRRHFESIPESPNRGPRPYYEVPGHEETLVALATDPEASNSQVAVYYKQPLRDPSTVGAYRQSIVEGLFNSMFNSRLQEIGQSANPPFLFAFSGQGSFVRTSEIYQLTAMVSNGGLETGLEAVLQEAERIKRFGFTSTELDREKSAMLRGMEQAYAERDKRDSRSLAAEYRRSFLTGEAIPGLELEWEMYQRFVPSVSLDEVNSLAAQWLVEENRVIVASSPESDDVPVPAEDEFLAALDGMRAYELEPYEDAATDIPLLAEIPAGSAVVAESMIGELGVTIWELGNGVRVLVKPTDFQDDQIVFRSFSPGGSSLIGDETFVSAMTAPSVVAQGGLGEFNLIDLQKKLSDKAVRVSASVGTYSEGVSGSASASDVETMFQLIYLNFTAPRRDTTAFSSFKTRMEGFFQNRGADPMAAFSDTVQTTLTQGHYRARPVTLELLAEMDLDESFDFYVDRFADASDFTFVFAGNIDLEQFRPLVETYLGGLPSIGRIEEGVDIGVEPPAGVIRKQVRRGVEPQSQTRITFTGMSADDSRENRYALASMAEALQIRLRERLREDLGGTYSVGVRGAINRAPEEGYSIAISFGSDPDRVEELIEVVFAEIDSISANGPSADDRDKVQQLQRRSHETNLEQNPWWVGQLLSAEQYNADPLNILKFDELVGSLTPEMMRDVAREFLRTDNYVIVSLVPENMVP